MAEQWSGAIGLGFVPELNSNRSWQVYEAIKTIVTHLKASKRVSLLATNDGQGLIILVHDLPREADAIMIARKFSGIFPLTPEEIEPLLEVHIFAGNDFYSRKAKAKQYVTNNYALFEGQYVWRVDLHPVIPPYEEPPYDPENPPVTSYPIEWQIPEGEE